MLTSEDDTPGDLPENEKGRLAIDARRMTNRGG
jgi:hypothetical protein